MKFGEATLLCIFFSAMLAFVSADITKDKAECQDQLITLSPCLNYVSDDEVKDPSPQCCKVLYEKINNTKKCLCILVKDRNEPSLGVKLNATRALMLPSLCHAVSNALECLGFLGLAPNSPEAQIFIQFANNNQAEANAPIISPKNDATKQSWTKMEMFDIVLAWCLAFIVTL